MRETWKALQRPWGDPPPEGYDWKHRTFWIVAMVGYYMLGWYTTQYYVTRSGRFYSLSTPLDESIPLRVEFVWGYALIFGMLVGVILGISRRDIFMNAVKGVGYMSTAAFLFFPIFPVRMFDRPDQAVHLTEGINAMATSMFYVVDQPVNCFPSMHLALGVWSGYVIMEEHPKLKPIAYFCMALVGVSVLMIRQHYLLDVVAGVAMAYGCKRLLFGGKESSSSPAGAEAA